jgi:hypothetical protein
MPFNLLFWRYGDGVGACQLRRFLYLELLLSCAMCCSYVAAVVF